MLPTQCISPLPPEYIPGIITWVLVLLTKKYSHFLLPEDMPDTLPNTLVFIPHKCREIYYTLGHVGLSSLLFNLYSLSINHFSSFLAFRITSSEIMYLLIHLKRCLIFLRRL